MQAPSADNGARTKKPILFDDHTDESKIELMYFVDSRVGKRTCKARCEFCFLKRPHLEDHAQDIDEAQHIIGQLRAQGYSVMPIVSDTFAENGRYLRSGLFKGGEWYMGKAAWSSGRPLLQDNWEELLDLCIDNGIDTIVMTSHGTEDKERPFKGLTQPSIVREAVGRVHSYSRATGFRFRITLTFTLSRKNCQPDQISRYLDYCEELGVDVARFNRFADIQGKYPEWILSREDVEATYRNLKEQYEAHPGQVQLSVSEDFGSWGVEIMGFPAQVGHCTAGERFYGVVYPYIYVCPVNLTVVAGKIGPDGVITWDEAVRRRLLQAKQDPELRDAATAAMLDITKKLRAKGIVVKE